MRFGTCLVWNVSGLERFWFGTSPYGIFIIHHTPVRDSVRVRAGARESNTSFFFSCLVNTFVFVGSVASYEYLIR